MNNNSIRFVRIRDNVIMPRCYGKTGAIGIFATIERDYVKVGVGETVVLRTGIVPIISGGNVLYKVGTDGRVIGEELMRDYNGELLIPFENKGDKPVYIIKQGTIVKSNEDDAWLVLIEGPAVKYTPMRGEKYRVVSLNEPLVQAVLNEPPHFVNLKISNTERVIVG